MMAHWAHFDHGADIGVRGEGATLAEAFEQVALALTGVVCNPAVVRPETAVRLECRAPDRKLLLMDWLNEIIYAMTTRGMLFGRYAVELDDTWLRGQVEGEHVNLRRHAPAVEVKGATLTGLGVRQEHGRWIAECVVDV